MKAQQIEQRILARTLPDLLPESEGWVLPHYHGLSIANLPATIANMLGADQPPALPDALPPIDPDLYNDWLPGLRRVVLVVLDALGYRILQRMWRAGEGQAFARLADAGRTVPLTSVYPSTTDAALVSLRTGVAPATHGWLAYVMYLREFGVVANGILLCPIRSRQRDMLVDWGLDAETMIPYPSLAEKLAELGYTTRAVLSSFLAYSAFTQMLYQGVEKIYHHRLGSDLWVQLRHTLAKTRGKKAFITAYWSGLDTLAHAYGPDADQWEAEFRTVSYLLERELLSVLPPEDRKGTLLLITADHGQIYIPPKHIVTVEQHPELAQHLMMPLTGESRAAFVYPRPGRAGAIRDYLEGNYPGWFTIIESAQALEAGLFGKPVSDETRARAGELLVLPNGNHALQQVIPNVSLLGRHGGLTADEMLVPLIGARLEALD